VIASIMPVKQATRELANLRRRGTITGILVFMIIFMIVRDVLARRRERLRTRSRGDMSPAVR
jgi:hypothetical protein